MKKRSYRLLWQSCSHFVGLTKRQKAMDEHENTSFPVFDIRTSATLEYAIKKMVAVKAHRLWVVDDSEHPIGVLSMTNIMEFLTKFK